LDNNQADYMLAQTGADLDEMMAERSEPADEAMEDYFGEFCRM
jgi:hypothetical protein